MYSSTSANSNTISNSTASNNLQKYGLYPLQSNFVPTEEEQALLDMYEVVRTTERVAARLKEEAARNKLNAKNEEFMKLTAAKNAKNNKKRRAMKDSLPRKKKRLSEDDDYNDDDDTENDEENVDNKDDDEDADDDDLDEDDVYERNEARLEKMREEVEAAKQLIEDQQNSNIDREAEKLRAEQLTAAESTNDSIRDGITILRKRDAVGIDDMSPSKSKQPSSSLIANLTTTVTPPHDFSKKLQLDEKYGGTVLFPASTDEFTWSPPEGVFAPNDGAFTAELDGFDISLAQQGEGNNTVAIKFMAPMDSRRFSVNITTLEHNTDFDSILFHFNPRQREKGGQLVVNDKQVGNWGQAVSIPLSQVPLMFGQTACTLMIQVTGDGFDVFVEGKHCCRLEHRKEIPADTQSLVLQFPSTDDYGAPENWMVYKVWWGNRPLMAKGDVSGIAGVKSYNSLHPRKLFISGLTKLYKQSEVDIRRAELERAFQKYGGAHGAYVIVPTKSTFAFVEFESDRQADLALQEMSSKYRLNRARRSKHEALQEERAAKEALKLAASSGGGHATTGNSKNQKIDKEWS